MLTGGIKVDRKEIRGLEAECLVKSGIVRRDGERPLSTLDPSSS